MNAKRRLFVKAYIIYKNGAKAAREAGYSAKTAKTMGSQLLTFPDVSRAIQLGIQKQQRELERKAEENGVTKELWLKELARIAFSSIDDVVKVRANGAIKIVSTAARAPELGRVIKKIAAGKYGPTIELHSKQAALDTLGKSYGWIKEQVEVSGPEGGPQVVLTLPANGSEKVDPETQQ